MRTNSSLSTTLFILFNILFSIPTQGQDATPSDPATAPPPSSNPPSPDTTTNPTPSSPPPSPDMTTNPTPSFPPPSPATAPPPSSPPAALNCSQCRINPIGLVACGLLIKGVGSLVTPITLRLCCRTLRPLTKEEGAACLCNAIKINTIKISNIDFLTAVDKVLAACSNL